MKQGAFFAEEKTTFNIWAPKAEMVRLAANETEYEMEKQDRGWWSIEIPKLLPGTYYKYKLDEKDLFPDPASNSQPEGANGYSMVVDHSAFAWNDAHFMPAAAEDALIYELHVGTYTPEGTFRAAVSHLDELKELGVTVIELMPVAQYPGGRNWGYDGVFHYAPQKTYGSPDDLKYLINEAHRRGISVILDVVYNHFGPEDNYINQFGYYYNHAYQTPWGDAINFDAEYSDEVRNFFIDNAVYWLDVFHFDGLRLDAVHSIFDIRAKHFLQELNEKTDALGKKNNKEYMIIAESDLNDLRFITPRNSGGYGCSAVWNDDFHHALHAFFTGEQEGYYADYGRVDDIIKALNKNFVYDGIYSKHRKHTHGMPTGSTETKHFIIFSQNHDQIGNRAFGRRLTSLVSFEELMAIAALVILSPSIPLLFMGEEYAEDNPFQYFISHNDANLVTAVREGRKKEFESFRWSGEIPDPYSEDTFNRSKLDHSKKESGRHRAMRNFYKELIRVRQRFIKAHQFKRENFLFSRVAEKGILYTVKDRSLLALFNLSKENVKYQFETGGGVYENILDTRNFLNHEKSGKADKTLNGNELNMSAYAVSVFSIKE